MVLDMNKKAIILDLDNTIYAVPSIGERLFSSLFKLIAESGAYKGSFDTLKDEIMRIPFHKVAEEYQFSQELIRSCIDLLRTLVYDGPAQPFPDYRCVKELPVDRYLVTAGFTRMQQSKIEQLGISKDFKQIYIVDHDVSGQTKKDVFEQLIKDHRYAKQEVLVIGDDSESEISAAKELGIDALLYIHDGHAEAFDMPVITSFQQLPAVLGMKSMY
jgi:putative hydrolase of the HAD superfamily